MNLEILAWVTVLLAAIPAVMFLWNLPQLKSPNGRVGQAFQPAGAGDFPVARSGGVNTGLESPVNRQAEKPALQPVSVLIPARNEAGNLRGALTSVLENRGVEFEVIVLDDHSEDGTADIVREIAAVEPRVRLENAPPLPPGWCGKQHACHVLAQLARHPLLLFVDADVRLAPDALNRLAAFMSGNALVNRKSQIVNLPALASGVPRQYTGTFLEKLLIPLIHFVLLGFLPVWRMRRCTDPAFGAGCGQLFVARAEAYRAAGGHAAIPDSLHDGLKLPRAFRRAGFRTDLFDATGVASCRMYHSGAEVVAGLTKNAHEGLAAPVMIGPWTLLLFGGHVLPWLLLLVSPWLTAGTTAVAVVAAALSWLPRGLAAWRFKQSWLGAALHPVGVAVFLVIQWRAFYRSFHRKPQSWKGRSYGSQPASASSAPLPSRAENAMTGK